MNEDKQNTENKDVKTVAEGTAAEGVPATKQATVKNDVKDGDPTKEVLNKAADAGGETAKGIVGKAQEKATSLLGDQKDNVAAGIGAVADSIRQIGENLRGDEDKPNQIADFAAQYGDSLAAQVENFSHYVENRDFKELARDAEGLARRNPTLFVGGALALGILAARFLKSSGSRQTAKNAHRAGSKNDTAVQAS